MEMMLKIEVLEDCLLVISDGVVLLFTVCGHFVSERWFSLPDYFFSSSGLTWT